MTKELNEQFTQRKSTPTADAEDIFAHYSAIQSVSVAHAADQQKVEFDTSNAPKQPGAQSIKSI
ncbi:cold shock domain-containing protein [Pandoraea anhela]|uniref:Cold shock-like protein CspG n=1 Tax=Pandoraea anhela TaxID=2508295 RepID=A0A5E4VQ59_9BURK|nr:cold shock domain-containing protein [Pandoraea anhela]VVE14351.1 Cold shock-like protein CspG [Pandoraea anhela]